MRRLFFLFAGMFFLVFVSFVFAADSSSEELYQDFIFKYRRYQEKIEPFKTVRSQYLTYQSVESQLKLIEAAKSLLLEENEAILAYTQFIRTRLAETTSILEYKENFLYIKLDDESAFFPVQNEKIRNISSLSEAKAIAENLKTHYRAVSLYAYQLKAITETKSAEKVFKNLMITGEKIQNYLENQKDENLKIKTAKERFFSFEKELQEASSFLKSANALSKNAASENTREIRQMIEQIIQKLNTIIIGYQNTVASLR